MAKKNGRPTKYTPKNVKKVLELAKKGKTDQEIANAIGVSRQTILNWKGKHKKFFGVLKKAKDDADSKVVEALYTRATGYTDPDGKHYPPDTVAMIFWLKNRQPEDWRDKREIDASVNGNLKIEVVKFAQGDSAKNTK